VVAAAGGNTLIGVWGRTTKLLAVLRQSGGQFVPTSIALGPDGSLSVTQLTLARLQANKPTGSVIRVAPDGTRTELGKGSLFFPAGAAVDATGAPYVSNWSILPGKAAPCGPFKGKNSQLVRIAP
jgi:sugar lactone lactonase YvrE